MKPVVFPIVFPGAWINVDAQLKALCQSGPKSVYRRVTLNVAAPVRVEVFDTVMEPVERSLWPILGGA